MKNSRKVGGNRGPVDEDGCPTKERGEMGRRRSYVAVSLEGCPPVSELIEEKALEDVVRGKDGSARRLQDRSSTSSRSDQPPRRSERIGVAQRRLKLEYSNWEGTTTTFFGLKRDRTGRWCERSAPSMPVEGKGAAGKEGRVR